MSDIYRRMKERREELGLTQEDLAIRMGYKSKSSINKIEMGKNDIPQSKVVAFAKALQTTTAYLMGVDEAKEASTIPPGFEPLPEMDSVPLVGRIAGYLIQSAGGVPRDHNNVRKSFQSLMKRLGIDGVSPHTCRHTAATRMLAAGLPVEVVQQILGHADATTTLNIYTHPDVTTLVSGVRKMD